MRKPTKARIAKLERLGRVYNAAMDHVFAAVHPRRDVILARCCELAPDRAAVMRAAWGAVEAYQDVLIVDGRGYRQNGACLLY